MSSANDFKKQAERKARDEVQTQIINHDRIFQEVLKDDAGIKARREEDSDREHFDMSCMVEPTNDKVMIRLFGPLADGERPPVKHEIKQGKPDLSERCMTVHEYQQLGMIRKFDSQDDTLVNHFEGLDQLQSSARTGAKVQFNSDGSVITNMRGSMNKSRASRKTVNRFDEKARRLSRLN